MSVEIDLRDVFAGLDAMRARAGNLLPVFKEMQPLLRQDLKEHFEKHEGPDGSWAPRARATIEKISNRGARFHAPTGRGYRGARTKGGKLRVRTTRRLANQLGRLRSAWRFRLTAKSLVAESLVDWSRAHDEGAVVGRGVRLEARPFAWASVALVDRFTERVIGYVVEAWGK